MTPRLDTAAAPATAGARETAPIPWAVVSLAAPVLLASLGAGIANVGLPELARAFDAPFRTVQWVVLAYLLATTILVVSIGRLADLLGRRRLLLAGLALFTAASLLCGLAPALWVLVGARALQGLGAAVMMTVATALVGDALPDGRVGRAMGVLASMSAVGTALGPSVGGILVAASGWRGLFLVNVPLGVAALLLARRHLPWDAAVRTAGRPAFDWAGTLLLAATLGAYALAMTAGRGRVATLNGVLLLAALVGGSAFVRSQPRSAAPLVRLSLLRDRALGAGLLTSAVISTVVMASLVVGPFYLAKGLGLAPALVGLALSAGPLASAATGVPAGRVVDRRGTGRATVLGLAGMLAGTASLAALPAPRLGVAAYLVPLVVVTAGYALVQTANNAAVMAAAPADQRGVVAALLGLSRNLGLVTGASAMGAVFAVASGATDVATAAPGVVATGMRGTFAAAAALVVVALLVAMRREARRAVGAAIVLASACAAAGHAQSADTARRPLKAMPVAPGTVLSLGGELRLRHDAHVNGQLARGDDHRQTLLRGVVGAELRHTRWVRAYAEVATGQVEGRRRLAGANFQNDAALQQLAVEVQGTVGGARVGAVVGRQEFADGPRQLVSVSDGPNLHRTWNGARLSAQRSRLRVGAFDLRVTRQGRADFDEAVDRAERLRGGNASVVVARAGAAIDVRLDPFWIRSEHPALRSGGRVGRDERDTYGARLWGRRGAVAFDWTLARQTGVHRERDVDAWALFAVQSVTLPPDRWAPRLGLRVDVASGGVRDSASIRSFHQLYASSAYVGEGQFLGLGNLVMVTPSLSVAPTTASRLLLEYGLARRLAGSEAVRAGGARAYEPTLAAHGRAIGGLLRASGSRAAGRYLTLFFTHEQLVAGEVLRGAGLPSGSYSHLGLTVRY